MKVDGIEKAAASNRPAEVDEDWERYVLVAEDDLEMRRMLAAVLRASGYRVIEARNGMELLDLLVDYLPPRPGWRVDLIISDVRMPGLTGMEVLEGMRLEPGFPPMILITAFGDQDTHRAAERFGVIAMLDKPFSLEDLVELVEQIVPLAPTPN
jgi:CheY-like chemotaxis protein